MRSILIRLPLVFLVTLGAPALASDGVLEIDESCAGETGCGSLDTAGLPGAPYALTGDSAWLEGCIAGLCLCPVLLQDDLTGIFALVELPTQQPGPWRLFEVHDVRWTLGRGDSQVEIRGRGLYRTAAPVLDEHRLVLELEIDGIAMEPLDSGVVPGALAFPEMRIQSLAPGDCYQEGVWLAAIPVPEPSIASMLIHGGGVIAAWAAARRRLH